jgi:ribonuclease-3
LAELSDTERVSLLEQRLGLPPGGLRPDLALEALRQRGWIHEHRRPGVPLPESNERLEFLGDAVLQLLVSQRIWDRFPKADEGELTRIRAAVVRAEALAQLARGISLGELLMLGRGEDRSGGRDKQSILADALEASVAAVYLSLGIDAVGGLVDRLFLPLLDQVKTEGTGRDWKSELQEQVHRTHRVGPDYTLIEALGADHQRTFEVEVRVAGAPLGRGLGRSKKEAEQAAARAAVERLVPPVSAQAPAEQGPAIE